PNCPAFQSWCLAEREEARRLRKSVLEALIERHASVPEKALPHARALVGADVDDVSAHVALLRLLVAAGRQREAEEQREVSARLRSEAGGGAAKDLAQAWRSLAGRPEAPDPAPGHRPAGPSAPAGTAEADEDPPPRAWPAPPAEGVTRQAAGESGRKHVA